MSAPSTADLLACAIEAAQEAGRHAQAHPHRRREAVARTAHDVKLALDLECQAKAEAVIRAAYPGHAILGEEGGAKGDGSTPQWIIDPIDGTVNFSHGLPYWCNSVAVQIGGRTVAGAVVAPELRHLYTATEDGPALRDGEPIRVSAIATLREALVLTGVERNFDQYPDSTRVVVAVTAAVQKVRLLGAAALDLCFVADGRVDGFYESGLNLWDVAAAELIVRRAGGHADVLCTLPTGRMRYVASNAALREAFRGLLSAFPAWTNPT